MEYNRRCPVFFYLRGMMTILILAVMPIHNTIIAIASHLSPKYIVVVHFTPLGGIPPKLPKPLAVGARLLRPFISR